MPEQSGRTIPDRVPPVVLSLLGDPATTKRLQASIAGTIAPAASILADFEATMAPTLASLIASAPVVADFEAKMARTLAGLVPTVPVVPSSVLRAPVVTSNAALTNRIEDALDRNTAFVVSTMASSVAPVAVSANSIDANVATIAKPRFRRLSLLFQVVGMFTVLVGAANVVIHLVSSLTH